MTSPEQAWYIYLIETAKGHLYTGITTDIERRFQKHQGGAGAKYLRGKGPLTLIGNQRLSDRSQASRIEYYFKRQTPEQKRLLIKNQDLFRDFVRKNLID